MYPIMADIGFDLAYQIDLALNSPKSPWMSKNRTLLNIQSDSLFMYLPIVEDGQVTGHFTTLSQSCVTFGGGVFGTRAKLYIPSTLNIDLILWHTQSIVCAVK